MPCQENLGAQRTEQRIEVEVGDATVSAELADDATERERGWKKRACDREAILLVPDGPGPIPVWGCELEDAIDVVGILDDRVVFLEQLAPCDLPCGGCPTVGDGVSVDAILEVPADALDISVGAPTLIPRCAGLAEMTCTLSHKQEFRILLSWNQLGVSNARLLQDNLELVVSRDPDLMPIFYGILFKRYPEVKPLFGRNSQAEQAKMLSEDVGILVANLDDPEFVRTTMLSVGQKHVDYGVEDRMHAWVGECLVATLQKVSAEAWTPELETAWTQILTAISGIAIEGASTLRREGQSS